MKRCSECFKKVPARDSYCQDCNILFYNLNKSKSNIRSKENNKMIDETETPVEEKEAEVSEEADKATETSE